MSLFDSIGTDVAELVSTPDGFRTWLESKREAEIVGATKHADICPVATYVRSHGFSVWVGPWEAAIQFDDEDGEEHETSVSLPLWVGRFVIGVDKLGDHVSVSAAEALEVLRDVV